MRIEIAIHPLHTRDPFRIARPRKTPMENVFVQLKRDGITGYGEASPSAFYGETAAGVADKLSAAANALANLPINSRQDVEAAWKTLWPILAPSRAAQCAIDIALWDFWTKSHGISLSEALWQHPARPITTFCTIGLSTPDELPRKIAEVASFPAIKVKSDQTADLAPLKAIRDASTAHLAVDANCAWGSMNLDHLANALRPLSIEFIEQPLPPAELHRLPPPPFSPPIFADENCVLEQDIPRIAPHFAGCNVKLVKCGGITPALRMLAQAKSLGLKTMVGCMIESSLLISAAAALAQQTDYADLDGAWLLAEDPYKAWHFEAGVLFPPQAPGLGAAPSA